MEDFGTRIYEWLHPNIVQIYTLAFMLTVLFQMANRRYRAFIPVTLLLFGFAGVIVIRPAFITDTVNFVYDLFTG